jgi:hypothetical protein
MGNTIFRIYSGRIEDFENLLSICNVLRNLWQKARYFLELVSLGSFCNAARRATKNILSDLV